MGHEREIAGVFCGASALLLIYQGQYPTAAALLGALVGFFIGEKNGERKSTTDESSADESSG